MSRNLHNSLLRPSVIQILRAAGYHSARPSVVDTFTDIAARFMLLLASTSVSHSINNHNDPFITVTDVRMAFEDCGLLLPALTASEEFWREALRREIDDSARLNSASSKESARRKSVDTRDVREFVEWAKSDRNAEIVRVAASVGESNLEMEPLLIMEDYVNVLKRKHSKTGEESRYQGTVLGKLSDNKPLKIEGGPADSLRNWQNLIIAQSSKDKY